MERRKLRVDYLILAADRFGSFADSDAFPQGELGEIKAEGRCRSGKCLSFFRTLFVCPIGPSKQDVYRKGPWLRAQAKSKVRRVDAVDAT